MTLESEIRRIIYEKFNDPDIRFTNDEIFEILKNNKKIEEGFTIDDAEPHFVKICDAGLTRNIAQNFTTMWFKLQDVIEKFHCSKCDVDVYLGKSEPRVCTECHTTV